MRNMHTGFAYVAIGSILLWFGAGLMPSPINLPMGFVALAAAGLAILVGLACALITQHE